MTKEQLMSSEDSTLNSMSLHLYHTALNYEVR